MLVAPNPDVLREPTMSPRGRQCPGHHGQSGTNGWSISDLSDQNTKQHSTKHRSSTSSQPSEPFRTRSRSSCLRTAVVASDGGSDPGLRSAVGSNTRYIATPITSKHRVFAWMPASTLPLVPCRGHCQRRRLHLRSLAVASTRTMGACDRHTASRGRIRLPLHTHDHLRDIPVPAPHRRTARESRGGRQSPRRAAQMVGLTRPASIPLNSNSGPSPTSTTSAPPGSITPTRPWTERY